MKLPDNFTEEKLKSLLVDLHHKGQTNDNIDAFQLVEEIKESILSSAQDMTEQKK
ncbi:hypothetical protein MM300_22400 [Evansella sp. LMS18]|uniref:hypothetical protein n=1 Tax=Evansella sp. LMS18 TaxID=2924033 RepID=UPI0020D1A0A7|nr:hypothetical protein [Evansella sp. LMS18]UTR10580.1 hypothetical protein MM300_22400 [Evansella sp. LMS18]